MKRQQSVTVIVITLIAALLIGLKFLGGFWPFRVINDQIVNPIGAGLNALGRSLRGNIDVFTRATQLAQENKNQQSEILALKNQLSTLKEVANENQLLRTQLNFNDRLGMELIATRVVASEGSSLRKYLTIDRGKNSGIQSGMAVVSSGVLVGVVDRVEDYSSSVLLATDPEFRIRAIGQDGRAQGIVHGQLGQGYMLEKITQAESVSPGEQIITSGSGLVPKGILIAEVEAVQKSDNAVFQSAQLKPLINNTNLELVFVVTGLKQ